MAFSKRKTGAAKQYDNTNRGALFVNDKGGNENRPDKRGQLVIKADDYTPDDNGLVTIYLSAWVRDNDKVGEVISIVAQPPRDQ